MGRVVFVVRLHVRGGHGPQADMWAPAAPQGVSSTSASG